MNMNANTEPTIDRRDIKTKWGLNKVSDVTNAQALGHPDWQNSKFNSDDAQTRPLLSSWYSISELHRIWHSNK